MAMYPGYPRHWLDPAAVLNIKEFLFLASTEVAVRLEFNPHAHETGLTDELAHRLADKSQHLTILQERLGKSKAKIELTVHETTARDEAKIGADLGIILRVATDDIQFQTSALFQAKRLQPGAAGFDPYCGYDLESSRSRKQASAMLKQNSASFFLLYNPKSLATKLQPRNSDQLDEVVERMWSYWIEHQEGVRQKLGNSLPRSVPPYQPAHIFGLCFDPSDGVCVLSSNFVASIRPSALKAGLIHKYTMPFADFMVDDLLTGITGDSSKGGVAVAGGRERNFSVRYSLGLDVRSGRFFTDEQLSPLFQ
jgi:tetrahydromethanopterin S-methyltransferase subunit G